jgi:Fe-S-cluster containining protein
MKTQRLMPQLRYYKQLVLSLLNRGFNRSLVWLGWQSDNPESTVEGDYYNRNGSCNQCGQCCQNIYLTYRRNVIETVETFGRVQKLHPTEYGSFEPIETTSTGVVFKCNALEEDNKCGRYLSRPAFCRTYPTEDSLIHGGKLPAKCSYIFEIKHTFAKVLKANLK